MKHPLIREAEALKEEMITWRRWLHAHAQTGFDLKETKEYVRTVLESIGYEVLDCGRCGLTASITGDTKGKVFLLRADMDALPIREDSGEKFACEDGTMHACGHDLHTAMLLGAAKLLQQHKNELNGSVKLMFQGAEEILQGAEDMIQNGILKDPAVDAGMMIHVATGVDLDTGTVLVPEPGLSAPAADYFTITIQGKGCHGSMPQEGIDPLTAAAHLLIALQEIHARELGIDDRAVLTVGSLRAGNAANVIPDTAELSGTIRTFDDTIRKAIKSRIQDLTEAIASGFRCKCKIEFDLGAPALKNDRQLCKLATDTLEPLFRDKLIFLGDAQDKGPSPGGSEDFAFISQKIPTVMLSLIAGSSRNGYIHPLHHPQVTFDEGAMPSGAAALTRMAIAYLNDSQTKCP